MRFKPTTCLTASAKRRQAAFTLAEVLAALLFMAIVIPVALQGLRIASLAGEVAARKVTAGRLGERVLNELVATGQWNRSAQNGRLEDGPVQYRWFVRTQPWGAASLHEVSVQVVFTAQGQEYDVNLATLVAEATQ